MPPYIADDRQLLERYLPSLKPIIRSVCARMGCRAADTDDFEQAVYVALLERGILTKADQAHQPRAFLHIVVSNLFRDFRIQRWGKWRPSAKASHLGETAIRLEKLMHQQGLSADQAVACLISEPGLTQSARELEAMARQLPPRVGRRHVGDDELEHVESPAVADRLVREGEARKQRRTLLVALDRALKELSDEDRTLVRLRFWEDASVASLSRMSGVPQRLLYTKFDRLRVQLRRSLHAAGVAEGEAAEMLAGWDGPLDREDALEP